MAEEVEKTDSSEKKAVKSSHSESSNVFARLMRFLREVVSELRKVIWPTRQELIRYTIVTIIFVSILVAFVSLIDVGLAKAVLYLFGDPDAREGTSGVGAG